MPFFYYDNDSNNGARWAFFAFFILLLLIFIFSTLRVNKRRLRRGVKPITGTAWMTPPSYYQSQTQYNEPLNSTNVPPYSENTLPNDAGYYDRLGNFVANPNYQPQQPPKSANGVHNDYTGDDMDFTRPSAPPPSHSRNPTGTSLNTAPDYGFNADFSNNNNNNSSTVDDDVELNDFTRPSGPPPTHRKS